jgi:hypothetical protein
MKLKISLITFSLLSYFSLFFFKDYSISGSQSDFKSFYFDNIQLFKVDFFNSIKNYGLLRDANYPLDYIFHAFLNPLSFDKNLFLLTTFFIGFLTFLIFAIALKKVKFSNIDSFSLASLILLLPWFSGRAYWGTSANLGIFLLILSFYYFIKIKINKNYFIKSDIFYLCLFSSAALYTRNSFIFFPIFVIFYLFINNYDIKTKIFTIINYLFLSLPGLILIYIWGDLHDTKNFSIHEIHNANNILKNLPILLNFIFFYLWPIFFIEFRNIGLKNFFAKYKNPFLFIFLVFLILSFFGKMNYLSNLELGGGVILEFGKYLNDYYNIIFLITASMGFSFIYSFFKFDLKNSIILFIPIALIFGFPQALYQDYLEPLIIVLFFLGIMSNNMTDFLKLNINKTYIIYFTYFVIYNYSALIYKNLLIF